MVNKHNYKYCFKINNKEQAVYAIIKLKKILKTILLIINNTITLFRGC